MAGQGRAGLKGAGERLCCGIAGAGADGPGGLKWVPGPGTGSGSPSPPKSLTVGLVNIFSVSHMFSLQSLDHFIILNFWTKSRPFITFYAVSAFFLFHNGSASEKISIH